MDTATVKPHQEIGNNQMRIAKIRYYLVMGAFAILATAIVIAMVGVIQGPDEAKITIGVYGIDGYDEETEEAMGIWNGFVGCEFLVPPKDAKKGDAIIVVMSENGEPCGDLWRPELEWGHAATAYDCKDGNSEIFIAHPGTTWMQTWSIGHEIGHTLKRFGVEHATIGIMGKTPLDSGGKPPMIRIRDRDVKALKEHFCE